MQHPVTQSYLNIQLLCSQADMTRSTNPGWNTKPIINLCCLLVVPATIEPESNEDRTEDWKTDSYSDSTLY